jgi:ribosome recycling factor
MLSLVLVAPALLLGPSKLAPMRPAVRTTTLHMDEGEEGLEVVMDADERMQKSLVSVQDKLMTLRVGRASPSMLDRVEVDYYDVPTPLNQLGSITVSGSNQLVISVYDTSCLGDVEKALLMSDLGMTPSNDGKVIRLNVPQLTEDRRKELAKSAKAFGEEGKTAIRNIRRDAIDKIKKMEKGGMGEDESKNLQIDIQDTLKKAEGDVDKAVGQREKDIMTI